MNKELQRETFECSICYSELPTRENIAYLECGHYFCSQCLKDYFDFMIKNGSVGIIKCPNSECK